MNQVIYDWSIQSGILFSENRCTVEASFLDAELKLLNQTISIICNNPSELHQAGFSFRIIYVAYESIFIGSSKWNPAQARYYFEFVIG